MLSLTYWRHEALGSFRLVAEEHIKVLQTKFGLRVGNVDNLRYQYILRTSYFSSEGAILHPVFYPACIPSDWYKRLEKVDEYFDFVRSKYQKLIGIETADTDQINPFLKKYLDQLDLLIVNSKWSKKAFKKTETNVRIEILPHGITEHFLVATCKSFSSYVCRGLAKSPKHKMLFFLWHSGLRKGIDIVSKICDKLKRIRDDWLLIVKEVNLHHELPSFNTIRLVGRWAWKDIVELYDCCDLVLCPSRSGGFELNALEGLARFKPVIYTKNTCVDEYAKDYGIGIRSTYSDSGIYNNPIHVGKGYSMNVDEAVKKICDVFDNPEYYYERASKFPREEYTWRKIGERLAEILRKV